MLKCANEHCPAILDRTVINSDDFDDGEIISLAENLRKTCKEKDEVSLDFIHRIVMEHAGAEIVNKIKYV